MAESSRATAQRSATLLETWRRLNFEQRVAAVGALLLIASTLGPFSFVEAAIALTAGGVLILLKKRADGRAFHLPFGDGTVIFSAGLWAALLIVVRLFDRELGQSILALACAGILAAAGARERAKRPADDLPPASQDLAPPIRPQDSVTERLGPADAPTEKSAAENASPGA
jgi:hypothetical protein